MVSKNLQSMVVVAALLGALWACGGGRKEPAQGAVAADAKRVDLARAGTVKGRVVIDGPVPANQPVQVQSDPVCMRANKDGLTSETFVVDNGGLENVFVYVKDGLGNYYFDVPTEPVKLDQQGCRYFPHVFGIRAGQPLEISNNDQTLHNVHALTSVNQEFNIGQAMAGIRNTRTFTAPEVMVKFKCDVHGWMNAYAGVLNHPYFAVTAGGGRFELKNLPAGTYTVEAWHEKLGTQTQTVTLPEKGSQEVTFTFRAPAAPGN
jgi:plastocyanin